MKTICLRLLTLFALAAGLNFISEAGIKIEEGKVFIVGRCLISQQEISDRLIKDLKPVVGIAQAEFSTTDNGQAVLKIKKIFSVKTDSDGYYLLKNVPEGFSYILLGTQLVSDQPLKIGEIKLVNAAERSSRVISLGTSLIQINKNNEYSMNSGKDLSITDYMQHFTARDNLTRFVHHVCNRTGYWGKGSCISTADVRKISLSGLSSAEWQRLSTDS